MIETLLNDYASLFLLLSLSNVLQYNVLHQNFNSGGLIQEEDLDVKMRVAQLHVKNLADQR